MTELLEQPTGTLHVRRPYRVDDVERALEWLQQYNLGTLVTAATDGSPRASASPLIVRRDRNGQPHLYAHLDRRNPQVEHLAAGRPLLYVAYGPRAYVSPAWFPRRPAAPTYLHITVHVRGKARMIEDVETTSWVLLETVAEFEGRRDVPWQYDSGERFLHGSARGVAAFEIEVAGIEAACKLSQDRSAEERRMIADALIRQGGDEATAVAQLLRAIDAT
jgi:transcriptional regulator